MKVIGNLSNELLEAIQFHDLFYQSSFKIMATALVTWTESLSWVESQPEESPTHSWMFGSLHTYTKIIVKLHWWHLGEHLHNRVGSMNLQVGRDRQATRLPSIVMPHDPTANETTTDHCETKDNRSISKNLFKMIGSWLKRYILDNIQTEMEILPKDNMTKNF